MLARPCEDPREESSGKPITSLSASHRSMAGGRSGSEDVTLMEASPAIGGRSGHYKVS